MPFLRNGPRINADPATLQEQLLVPLWWDTKKQHGTWRFQPRWAKLLRIYCRAGLEFLLKELETLQSTPSKCLLVPIKRLSSPVSSPIHYTSGPFWKPSVTPYVVSFWVRQSLRHAYALRFFAYAKQIEETLTRSPRPYASKGFAYPKRVMTRPVLKM